MNDKMEIVTTTKYSYATNKFFLGRRTALPLICISMYLNPTGYGKTVKWTNDHVYGCVSCGLSKRVPVS